MNCIFCNIIKNNKERIIKETKYSIVVLSDPKLMSGHFLVIPKHHVEKLSEMSKEERDDLVTESINMQNKVLEKISPGCDICQHYRPFIPDNAFKVTHLHIHIRPRTLDDELYMKVQINEAEIFSPTTEAEVQKYRKIVNS